MKYILFLHLFFLEIKLFSSSKDDLKLCVIKNNREVIRNRCNQHIENLRIKIDGLLIALQKLEEYQRIVKKELIEYEK